MAVLGTLPRTGKTGLGPGILGAYAGDLPETIPAVVLLATVGLRGPDSPGWADNSPESEVSGMTVGEWVFWAVTMALDLVAIQLLAKLIIKGLKGAK